MIFKLTGYEDLYADDAKYHRLYYSHYIPPLNILASIRKNS